MKHDHKVKATGRKAATGSEAGAKREIEFKLGVRRSHVPRVAEAVGALAGSSRDDVRSLYYDTLNDQLAADGISLRLRLEGSGWVQTIKWRRESGNRQRFEHEVQVPGEPGATPTIRLDRHRGTVAGDRAAKVLRRSQSFDSALVLRYLSQVQRVKACVKRGKTDIEIAFDRGHVEAAGQRLPVDELELELKRGGVDKLVEEASSWMKRDGLWLLEESEADRGLRLARSQALPNVVKAHRLSVDHANRLDDLSRAVLANCLAQILPNAAAIAEGSQDTDHVHQVRVGLRRLRTAIQAFGAENVGQGLVAAEPCLAGVFRQLGQHRDQEQIRASIGPRVQAETGTSRADWARQPSASVDLRRVVRDTAFQSALLSVARVAQGGQGSDAKRAEVIKSRKWLRPKLDRLHRDVARCGRRFYALPAEQQHKVRKRLKRLRYLSEFSAPLFSNRQVGDFLHSLEPAQDALGEHNDLAEARSLALSKASGDVDAQIAAEWIEHEQKKTARKAMKQLGKVRQAREFW